MLKNLMCKCLKITTKIIMAINTNFMDRKVHKRSEWMSNSNNCNDEVKKKKIVELLLSAHQQ